MADDSDNEAGSAPETLGELIRAERQRQSLSVRQLSRLVGVDPSTVVLWERGENVPRSRYLASLARALEISVNDLMVISGAEGGEVQSLPAMLRAGYDDLPPEAITKIERYVARTARQYGATKKTTNEPSPHERRTP